MPEQLSKERLRQSGRKMISTIYSVDKSLRTKKQPKERKIFMLAPHPIDSLSRVKKQSRAIFWPLLGGVLVLGLLILAIVTYSVSNWFTNFQRGFNTTQKLPAISNLKVQRSALYSDLDFTWMTVQSTTAFSDDPISVGPKTVRVVLHVANPTGGTINLTYYDIARLLVPGQKPIAPTNLNLSASLLKKANQTGWIDFPVSVGTKLSSLKLQFGNASIHELLVVIPSQGTYSASQYATHSYHESLTINYFFQGFQIPGYLLTYHLTSVDVRDSYAGAETKAGDEFYVLNFSVDNANGVEVQPGYGYDYIRLELNPNRPPIDNTLPYGFKANAQGSKGHVTYSGPAGLRVLNIAFLYQAVAGWSTYTVSL